MVKMVIQKCVFFFIRVVLQNYCTTVFHTDIPIYLMDGPTDRRRTDERTDWGFRIACLRLNRINFMIFFIDSISSTYNLFIMIIDLIGGRKLFSHVTLQLSVSVGWSVWHGILSLFRFSAPARPFATEGSLYGLDDANGPKNWSQGANEFKIWPLKTIFSRGHATLHLAELVGPSVTFLNCKQFSHYCSCRTVRD